MPVQHKRRYFLGRTLDPDLVAYYYHQFGHIKRILDLGCGFGCMGRLKPDRSIEVYGLDIDETAVAEAKKHENAQIWNLENQTLPFDTDYFDAVLAKDIFEHLQTPWVLVREIYRVLRPSGAIIASTAMAKPKVVWDDYTHVRGFTHNALRLMFEDNGFEVIHIKKMGGIPLAGKLHLVRWIPVALKFPPLDLLFGKSLEIKARKPIKAGRE